MLIVEFLLFSIIRFYLPDRFVKCHVFVSCEVLFFSFQIGESSGRSLLFDRDFACFVTLNSAVGGGIGTLYLMDFVTPLVFILF